MSYLCESIINLQYGTMSYLCEKYYKLIAVQYYVASCVSWVPRLTLLDLRTCFWNGPPLYIENLLYFVSCQIANMS